MIRALATLAASTFKVQHDVSPVRKIEIMVEPDNEGLGDTIPDEAIAMPTWSEFGRYEVVEGPTAVEGPLGTWRMLDPEGREYGVIRLVRVDGQPKYRAEFRGELIGYGGTLRLACERVQYQFIAAHGPRGGAAAIYPIHTPSTSTVNPPQTDAYGRRDRAGGRRAGHG